MPEELSEPGMHNREDTAAIPIPNSTPASFHLLAKPTGSVCNLDCAYCFFLEKEQLYPDAKAR